MAAFWPSHIWPPVLEASCHSKTGVQKDFTIKLCLCEIKGGKAHKMIIQYKFQKTRFLMLPFVSLTGKGVQELIIMQDEALQKASNRSRLNL